MKRTLVFSLLFALLSAPAAADGIRLYDLENWLDGATSVRVERLKPWKLNLGVGVGMVPEFRGADELDVVPLPVVDLEWRNKLFLSTQRGLGYNWVSRRDFRLATRITLDLGRDSGVDPNLAGVPDVDPSPELGLFAEWFEGAWRLRADIRRGLLTGHEGWLVNGDAAFGGRVAKNLSIIVGAEITWASEGYMNAYFDVPATATRLPAFDATGSFRDFGGHISVIFDLTRSVYVSLDAGAGFLLSDASDSPISFDDLQAYGTVVAGVRF